VPDLVPAPVLEPEVPETLPARRADEVRALARQGWTELRHLTSGIGDIHTGLSDRVFSLVGPRARPVKVVHDAIAGGVYTAVRASHGLLGRATDAGLARRELTDPRPLSTSPRGAAVLAAINGLVGDELHAAGSDLQEPMAIRVAGDLVPPDPGGLATAFPDPAPRVVVFLHGLMETEHAWALGGRETYGARLARDLGVTPVFVRFNTGRHISENGRSLADLLGALFANWPVPVEEIALVGHSMGGLVARSACHRAADRHEAWTRTVRHVVSLGSPHMGAPLAQGVHWLSHGLDKLPETRPVANFLRRRSSGIRDLRHGSLVDEDWLGRDPDELRAAACAEVPLLEGATHCFVTATVTRSPRHPVGRLVGDWLVLGPSAAGKSRTRRLAFEEEHGLRLGGANHLALLNHPQVYAKLREWLSRGGAQSS
jgi:pimeloyl-ACP methyl ester carboxylesterase